MARIELGPKNHDTYVVVHKGGMNFLVSTEVWANIEELEKPTGMASATLEHAFGFCHQLG